MPPPGTHAVTVVAGLACPDPGSPGQSASPSPKPLPSSVAIKAVVRCETVQRSYPGLGTWSVQLAEVADSDLGPFLADLRAPSDAMPSGMMCPDIRILVPWFELVDSAGTAINVAIPTDQCGAPKTAAITALEALHFRVTDAVRIAAELTRRARASAVDTARQDRRCRASPVACTGTPRESAGSTA